MTTPPDTTPKPAETAEKPPTKWLLAYRVLGLRLPAEYRAWVAKDVASKGFLTRRIGRSILWSAFFLALYYVMQTAWYEAPAIELKFGNGMVRAALVALAACLLASGATLVRNTLRWQRIDRHGRPVKPKPRTLAILDNGQAALLGVIAVVLFAGASVIYAQVRVVPDGPLGEKCRKPSAETIDRIRGGLKQQSTEFTNPQEIRFSGDSKMVGLTANEPSGPRRGVIFVVTPDAIYELGLAAQAISTFPSPSEGTIDRVGAEALRRVADCLSEAIRG